MRSVYSPVFSLATGWVVGVIENHTARPLTEAEVKEACDALIGSAASERITMLEAKVNRLAPERDLARAELEDACEQIRATEVQRDDARQERDAVSAELERLRAVREQECTCALGDAREAMHKHERTCSLRVNRLKRIPPGVALDRLAKALDHGKENDELCAALLEACDLADEANGDPSSCSYNVMIGERIAELRGRSGDAADLVAERDAARKALGLAEVHVELLIRERDGAQLEVNRLRAEREEWRRLHVATEEPPDRHHFHIHRFVNDRCECGAEDD